MTIQEIANRLIELANKGDFETIYKELFSPDIVSIEPKGAMTEIAHGLDGIAEKGKKWNETLEAFHGQKIGEPIFGNNFFALSWTITVTFKGADKPVDSEEICVYEVKDGKIVKEQFFYTIEK